MLDQKFTDAMPHLIAWIDNVLESHSRDTKFCSELNFPRLANYYSPELLANSKVVVVEELPKPPLVALGLSDLAFFEQMDAAGITYKDTYFVQKSFADHEDLHFHELIHVIQWKYLGPERFVIEYAKGLLDNIGVYENAPLEKMAYYLGDDFDNGYEFNAEEITQHFMNDLYPI